MLPNNALELANFAVTPLACASVAPVSLQPFCFAGGLPGKVLQLSAALNGRKKRNVPLWTLRGEK